MRSDAVVEDWPQNNTRSNLDSIILDLKLSFNYDFSYKDFVPGEDFSTTWKASVHDLKKDARLVVRFTDKAGNDTTIEIDFYSWNLIIRPNLDFKLIAKGDTVYKDIWVINASSQHPEMLDSLRLKFKNQGFDITGIDLPQIIPPLDSLKFQIRFIATQDGQFSDSVGCGNPCWMFYTSQVKAKVGSSTIQVSDYDFGNVPVNQPAQGTIHIKNIGIAPLTITDFIHPALLPIYTDELRPITAQSPLVLNPGISYDYLIDFIPIDTIQYSDTMYFISNTTITPLTDSIAILNGRGVIKVGIKENILLGDEFSIYPNPVDDILNIQFNNIENISLKIIDIYGNLVDELKSVANTQSINYNTSMLVNGLYIVQLNTGKKIIAKTFMVLH
jgi:hypothetical protein